MSKFISKIIVLLILSMAVLPTQIYSEEPTPEPNPGCPENAENCGYVMLAPIFQEQVGKPVTMSDYLSKIYNILFLTAGIVATIMLIIGGFQYMISEVASTKAAAKDRMYNAIWGLLLAIFSYTILYTLNPELLNIDFKLKKIILKPAPVVQDTGTTAPETPDMSDVPSGDGSSWPSDSVVRDILLNQISGFSINKANCQKIGDSNCTSVVGLGSVVTSKLKALQESCNCQLTLTGGTEFWLHGDKTGVLSPEGTNKTGHRPNGNVIDLSLSGGVTKEIESKGEKLENYKGCHADLKYARYRYNGGVYVKEGDHWHVCY